MFLHTVRNPRYALDVTYLGHQIPLSELNPTNYATHFRNLLIEERQCLAEEFKLYNLFEVAFEAVGSNDGMYRFSVRGVERVYSSGICRGFPCHSGYSESMDDTYGSSI